MAQWEFFFTLSHCSTMWVGCQSRRFLCLFWRETRQRILGPEISPYPEVVRGREWELAGLRSWVQLTGNPDEGSWRWTAERRAAESWRGTTDRGSQHWTPETVGDKIGSSEEDWLKMSAFEVLVEFSLVTHVSDSLHMEWSVAYFPLLLVYPKLCSCLFVCFIFSYPPDRILVWWQEMCVTPSNH